MKARLLTAAIFLFFAGAATAASEGGFYLAVGAGSADSDEASFGLAVDDSDTGFQGLIGFDLFSYLSIEGGFVDFGDADAIALPSGLRTQAQTDGVVVGVRAQYEFSDHFYLQGRLGAFLWETEAEALAIGTANLVVNESGEDPYLGVGVRWDFAEDFGASLDYTHYASDIEVDFVSATFYWRFDF